MSQRDMWKMLHLLHLYGKPGLSGAAIRKAGIICEQDTIYPLLDSGAIEERMITGRRTPEYFLSQSARAILQACVVANKRSMGEDIRVDYPHAFVIMPFTEKWSSTVYKRMIEPAVKASGLECTRGDTGVRVGDLTTNIWNQILRTGIVIADVSSANVNVFYELGLAHAVGKDTLLLKRKDAQLPADFGGAHYYEYDLKRLPEAQKLLKRELKKWVKTYRASHVKALERV